MTANDPQKDHWSSEAYQTAASFVPKLAGKITQWLDPQKDDIILDIGCGDGILNIEMAKILAQGTGKVHGIDASPAMIEAAKEKAAEAFSSSSSSSSTSDRCTFETLDAMSLPSTPHLQTGSYTKAFSNAAMHWILRPDEKPDRREGFFRGVRDALVPGGKFAFEMGGAGNVNEIRAVLLSSVGRRLQKAGGGKEGLRKAMEADPWFFPDEEWIRDMMEGKVGGWVIEKMEREYRPTPADPAGGVEGWVRLMGARFFEAIEDFGEREECIRECVEVLEVICANPGREGWTYGYVRLRVLARKI